MRSVLELTQTTARKHAAATEKWPADCLTEDRIGSPIADARDCQLRVQNLSSGYTKFPPSSGHRTIPKSVPVANPPGIRDHSGA